LTRSLVRLAKSPVQNSVPPTRFCVLTVPRSGSTHLVSLLNSHPQVSAYEELFLARPVRKEMCWVAEGSPERFFHFRQKISWPRPISTFRYVSTIHGFDHTANAVGFKLMVAQAISFPELLACLYGWNYHVLFLVRRNLLEECLSAYIRLKTGISHSREVEWIRPVEAPVSQLLDAVKRRRRQLEILERLLRVGPYPSMRIEYERLRDSPDQECKRILRFLKVNPDVKIESKIKKRVTVGYDTLLNNYGELYAAFTEAGLGEYLP
jgi:hypothetical protein